MQSNVEELAEFYSSQLGQAATRSISMALSGIWETSTRDRLLGLGYPVPYLDKFAGECGQAICLMPASQGAVQWPLPENCATAMSYDNEFPLRDGSVDCIIMTHFLEHAENAHQCLSEAWRVLSTGGQLYIVIPNRRGVWARFETTPFGTGSPYSKGQLKNLLRQADFVPEKWGDALHFAPSKREFPLKYWQTAERIARTVWPVFAGVVLVSARKQLYQGIPVTSQVRRRVSIPVLVPQGTGRANRSHR